MDNDGSDEPPLRLKRTILIISIVTIFMLGTVSATVAPIVEQKKTSIVKKKIKTISGYFKPNTKSLPYKWYYKTWQSWCPYCGHHLLMNPKGVPERELTCSHCDADFEGVQGYVKNGKKNKKLRKA